MVRFVIFLAVAFAAAINAPLTGFAQIQLQTNYQGATHTVVDSNGEFVTLSVDGKNKETTKTEYQIRAHDTFGEGLVQIRDARPDFHPSSESKTTKKRPEIRFRYTAEVVADRTLEHCYGLMTFLTEGSIGSRLVKVGRLESGKPMRIQVDVDVPVGSVGSLHVFSHGLEIRSNQHPTTYDVQEYYATLTAGIKGLPAAALLQLKDWLPHVLSPDGRQVVTLRYRDGSAHLIVYDLESMKLVCDAPPDEYLTVLRDLTWVSDHEIAYISTFSLRLLDTQTGKTRKLRGEEFVKGIIVIDGPPDTVMLHAGVWREYMIKFNVHTGKSFDRVEPDEGGYIQFDRKGVARVRIQQDLDETLYSFRPSPQSDWKFLDHGLKQKGLKFNRRSWESLDRVVDLHSVGPDGDILYISTRVNGDKFELAAFSMSKGVIVQTIASHPRYDLTTADGGTGARLLFAKQSPRLLGMTYEAQKPRVIWLDEGFAAAQKNIDKSIPDHANIPVDWTDDGRSFIYFSFSDRDPGTYYAFRPYEGKLVPLLQRADQLSGKSLAQTTPFEFSARDGQRIPAQVTRPPGSEHERTPLLVCIHGGPMARDTWSFDPENQFFASRGYKVLQVNYRGSSGYGAAFQAAGLYARLDTVVIDDIVDGVRCLLDQGEVDPQRIAVMGASFGGWATYLCLIRYPDLFRCGIAISAVSNWRADMKQTPHEYVGGYEFWKTLLNRRDFKAEEKFIEPTLRAGEIKQPVMIMHGRQDRLVSPVQAQSMYDTLRRTNSRVQIRWYEHAAHNDWPIGDRVSLLNDAAAFLTETMAQTGTTAH